MLLTETGRSDILSSCLQANEQVLDSSKVANLTSY